MDSRIHNHPLVFFVGEYEGIYGRPTEYQHVGIVL
jgi:hypothetical protein